MIIMEKVAPISQSRIDWIDIAKGYGIIFVILGHIGLGTVGRWIYTFHIPLFFFLSGYVFNDKYDFKVFVERKIKSLIIPYFCLGIPIVVYECISAIFITGDFTYALLINLIMDFLIQRRAWAIWYLTCLFCLNIIFYLIHKYVKNFKLLTLLSIVFYIIGLTYYYLGGHGMPWNIDVCSTAFIYYLFGYICKNKDFFGGGVKRINISWQVFAFLILGLTNVVLGMGGIIISGKGFDMFHNVYGFPPLNLAASFAGIICVILFSTWFNLKSVKYIGKNSMVYFAWHSAIILPLLRTLEKKMGYTYIAGVFTGSNILIIIFEFLTMIVVLTLCSSVISKKNQIRDWSINAN